MPGLYYIIAFRNLSSNVCYMVVQLDDGELCMFLLYKIIDVLHMLGWFFLLADV